MSPGNQFQGAKRRFISLVVVPVRVGIPVVPKVGVGVRVEARRLHDWAVRAAPSVVGDLRSVELGIVVEAHGMCCAGQAEGRAHGQQQIGERSDHHSRHGRDRTEQRIPPRSLDRRVPEWATQPRLTPRAKVSHWFGSPARRPVINHFSRCAELPWVNWLWFTCWPAIWDWMKSSPIRSAVSSPALTSSWVMFSIIGLPDAVVVWLAWLAHTPA